MNTTSLHSNFKDNIGIDEQQVVANEDDKEDTEVEDVLQLAL